MAIPFYSNIDLNKNQLQKVTLGNEASEPAGVANGYLFYDSTDNRFKFYENGSWVLLGSGALTNAYSSITDGSVTASASGGDTIKFRSGTGITVAVASNDVTHGDNVLISLASHSHTAADISDFDTEVSNNTDVAANTGARHTQNTDTGTTSTTWALDSDAGTPLKLKNVAGELNLRNDADNAYVDLRVKNLYVEGTQTIINSNEVNIGDSNLLLNADITDNANNSDGGISVKLLDSDDSTRRDAQFYYDATSYRWKLIGFRAPSGAPVTRVASATYAVDIGDGVATTFTVTHNLNSDEVSVTVYNNSTNAIIYPEVTAPTVDTVSVTFSGLTPTSNQFRVIVVG